MGSPGGPDLLLLVATDTARPCAPAATPGPDSGLSAGSAAGTMKSCYHGFMRTLRVTYSRAGDLRLDLDGQIRRGGLLVQFPPSPDLRVGSAVTLEICAGPAGPVVSCAAQVVYLQAGVCVTVALPTPPLETLDGLVYALPKDGAAPRHEIVGAEVAVPAGSSAIADTALPMERRAGLKPRSAELASPREAAGATAGTAGTAGAAAGAAAGTAGAAGGAVAGAQGIRRLDDMSQADKIQLALHGNADDRAAILRDRLRSLHQHVLRNPQITIEEVLAIAKSAGSGVELLEMIGGRKEWVSLPSVALALARNPRTPPGVGLRALVHVSPQDLRQLAKGTAPPHIQAAAKKKILS